VNNEKTDGGQFYLNICDYLNQYDEDIKIPSSCIGYSFIETLMFSLKVICVSFDLYF